LAALYAGKDEHRDATENEEDDVGTEHVVYPAIDTSNPPAGRKVADATANEVVMSI
jgi:hypothetical protein